MIIDPWTYYSLQLSRALRGEWIINGWRGDRVGSMPPVLPKPANDNA